MVSALLDGSKTQTRRIVKPQPTSREGGISFSHHGDAMWSAIGLDGDRQSFKCPHPVGSFIWCREAHWACGLWEQNGRSETGRQKWKFRRDKIITEARFETSNESPFLKTDVGWYKRLARFMFRRDSRITLEVTGVKVERLNDISEGDAKAEGIGVWCPFGTCAGKGWLPQETPTNEPRLCRCADFNSIDIYKLLWESINGKGSWALNPYVWAYTLRRVKP